jgi:hypothetical protein
VKWMMKNSSQPTVPETGGIAVELAAVLAAKPAGLQRATWMFVLLCLLLAASLARMELRYELLPLAGLFGWIQTGGL